MIKASKVRRTRNELKSKQLKEHNELVNKEMLEVEKAINKYMNDILDTNDYVDIPIIIKTDEVKQALKDAEWYIDKSQSVEYGHTYIKEITQDDIKYDKKSDEYKCFNVKSRNSSDISYKLLQTFEVLSDKDDICKYDLTLNLDVEYVSNSKLFIRDIKYTFLYIILYLTWRNSPF